MNRGPSIYEILGDAELVSCLIDEFSDVYWSRYNLFTIF